MSAVHDTTTLFTLLDSLNKDEERRLSPAATLSTSSLRRTPIERRGHRQPFALDADRILHSRAYSRYIDKTQVFCLISNDHITHRIIHVQLVSRVARTIGRFLHLNEDLIEAIALGHDIGHPPFGHEGESFLSELCVEHGLPPFQHNIQSVRFLDQLERRGKGWNLSLQTLDGILCHDGEVHSNYLSPQPEKDFSVFDAEMAAKEHDPSHTLVPMTPEGCVVRLSDTIAYIGRDIEDAIILGLIKRTDIPEECCRLLGDTNGSIVYNLVTDLITNSHIPQPGSQANQASPRIGFSDTTAAALAQLKKFNYSHIYHNPQTKKFIPVIKSCYRQLFTAYLDQLTTNETPQSSQVDLMTNMGEDYLRSQKPEAMVRDYIAGMTDDFFLKQAAGIGCSIPQKQ